MKMPVLKLFILCSFFTISGCINSTTALRLNDIDLMKKRTLYLVELPQDKDNHKIIKANLEKRGFIVTSGLAMPVPYKQDIVVTYLDRWWWDITPYMIDLSIVFREPHDNFPIAGGSSFHTSTSRLSPEDMVDEVLNNVFNSKPMSGAIL